MSISHLFLTKTDDQEKKNRLQFGLGNILNLKLIKVTYAIYL